MVRAEIMTKLVCHNEGVLIEMSAIGGRYTRYAAGRISLAVITQRIDVSHT